MDSRFLSPNIILIKVRDRSFNFFAKIGNKDRENLIINSSSSQRLNRLHYIKTHLHNLNDINTVIKIRVCLLISYNVYVRITVVDVSGNTRALSDVDRRLAHDVTGSLVIEIKDY